MKDCDYLKMSDGNEINKFSTNDTPSFGSKVKSNISRWKKRFEDKNKTYFPITSINFNSNIAITDDLKEVQKKTLDLKRISHGINQEMFCDL